LVLSGDGLEPDVLRKIAEQVDDIHGSGPGEGDASQRLDLFAFISYDIVGSTELKAKKPNWPRVIRYFYDIAEKFATDMISDTNVWKYLGDEILLYKQICAASELTGIAINAFECLRAVIGELEREYEEESHLISVKGVLWVAPVTRFSQLPLGSSVAAEYQRLIGSIHSDDVLVSADKGSHRPFDFLGPNIDAGFRLATFARPKQLVVSPMLANYLRKRGSYGDGVKLVDVARLKGVAQGALYPGLWYHQNWPSIRRDFRYDQRFMDKIAQRVCAEAAEAVDVLDEICQLSAFEPYLIDPDVIDEIIELSSRVPEPLSVAMKR